MLMHIKREQRRKEDGDEEVILNFTSPATSTGGTGCSTCCRGSLRTAPRSGSRGSIWRKAQHTEV